MYQAKTLLTLICLHIKLLTIKPQKYIYQDHIETKKIIFLWK